MPPRLHVFLTGLLVQIAQRLVTEMIEYPPEPSGRLIRSGVILSHVLRVDGNYVGNRDVSGVTVVDTGRGFFGEVVAQAVFSFCNFALACASAALDAAVPD